MHVISYSSHPPDLPQTNPNSESAQSELDRRSAGLDQAFHFIQNAFQRQSRLGGRLLDYSDTLSNSEFEMLTAEQLISGRLEELINIVSRYGVSAEARSELIGNRLKMWEVLFMSCVIP